VRAYVSVPCQHPEFYEGHESKRFGFVCSWDTRRWIKSKSTIRSILTHHRQNPTSYIPSNVGGWDGHEM
jgi:hypothetical protein